MTRCRPAMPTPGATRRVEPMWGTVISLDVLDPVDPIGRRRRVRVVPTGRRSVQHLAGRHRDQPHRARRVGGRAVERGGARGARAVRANARATGGAFDIAVGAIAPTSRPARARAARPVGIRQGLGARAGGRPARGGAARRGAAAINAGGDVVVRGGTGRRRAVAGRHPASVATRQGRGGGARASGAVATSGRTERGDHVIDPRTGRPATGLVSATVVAADLAIADALATAAVAHGSIGAPWLAGPDVAALGITDAGAVVTTRASTPTALRDYRVRSARFWQSGSQEIHMRNRVRSEIGMVCCLSVRKLSVPIIAVVAALALAACGGGSSKASTSGSPPRPPPRRGRGGFLNAAFTTCLKQHGVTLPAGFGGRRPAGAADRVATRSGAAARGSPAAAPDARRRLLRRRRRAVGRRSRSAFAACRSKLPNGGRFGGGGGSPAAPSATQLKAYMSCLERQRREGADDDLEPRGWLRSPALREPLAGLRNDPHFAAASKKCAPLLPARGTRTPDNSRGRLIEPDRPRPASRAPIESAQENR